MAYKQLEQAIQCEPHHGHCFISHAEGHDNHHHLSHAEMTLQAKTIVSFQFHLRNSAQYEYKQSLGHATIYNLPHCLNFDHGPTKKPCNSQSSAPEVHVTIQNITPNTVTEPSFSSMAQSPPPYSQPCVHHHLASMASANETCPANAIPSLMAHMSIFPYTQQLMEIVKAAKPGQGFAELEGALYEAGLISSDQILLLTEDALGVIGDMGVAHAQILQNHARCLIFPLLGFQNTYARPELAIDLDNTKCQDSDSDLNLDSNSNSNSNSDLV